MVVLEVKKLGKKYSGNDFYSLKDADFRIVDGEIVGLVGKNGSGKSTLLKCIAKSQRPSHGQIFIDTQDIYSGKGMLDNFGIMIDPVFFPQISVLENLKLYLKIHQKEEYDSNIEYILRLVGLWDARYRKPKDFSFGMKQRTALAIALITEPKFLLLDEPFVGLDPIGVKNLLAILKEWAVSKQTSMLISSHQLSELEELCDRFLFIEAGVISEANPADAEKICVELISPIREKRLLEQLSAYDSISFEGRLLEIPVDMNEYDLNHVFKVLAEENKIKSVLSKRDHLQKLFVED